MQDEADPDHREDHAGEDGHQHIGVPDRRHALPEHRVRAGQVRHGAGKGQEEDQASEVEAGAEIGMGHQPQRVE